jgi:hypothetical protein
MIRIRVPKSNPCMVDELDQETTANLGDLGLSAQHDVDARQNLLETLWRQLSNPFAEVAAIDCEKLSGVGYRVLREARQLGREECVPRCGFPRQVACEGNAHYCRESAAVQRITLNYHHRSAKSRR